MKKIKGKLVIIIILLISLFIGICLGVYLYNNKGDGYKLTLEENQWIDSNKREVIDIAIINDIPIINYDGEGLIYDYLDYVKEKIALEFNIITYKYGTEVKYPYKMDIVSDLRSGDISIYKDNLVYISARNHEYNNKEQMSNLKIGVLNSQKEELSNYFGSIKLNLVGYEDLDKLKAAMREEKTNLTAGNSTSIDGIIVLKSMYTKEIIENDYKIAYNFGDLVRYYVLNIQDNKELTGIMNKKYLSWAHDEYKKSYNKNLLNAYYNFKKITDTDEKKLKSKSYNYGFIRQGIINDVNKKQLRGFNNILLKEFSDFSGTSVTFTKFNSVNNMVENFNSGKVDFILNEVDKEKYTAEIYETAGAYNKKIVAVSGINNRTNVSDIGILKGMEVLTIKDTSLDFYLKNNGIKTKTYNDFQGLVNDFHEDDIAVLDLENYNYYKTAFFKNARVSYLFPDNSKYNFVINDKNSNKIFASLFNFYITYTPIDDLIFSDYSSIAYESSNLTYVMILIIIILSIYIVIDFSYHIKILFKAIIRQRKIKMTKEDKMKYIDQLTSLKNRNYLNSKIEEWDDSEIYPQAIIIVDLNNVSYINDNYGREEGDKVIKEAANVLMQYQLENSEIIRTDGNEFLIFLVGYTEKQIISYLRKLTKEFKNLSHGFGAASGYSIINDAIKTFDDAVNEAVLDMKNNKEDIDY